MAVKHFHRNKAAEKAREVEFKQVYNSDWIKAKSTERNDKETKKRNELIEIYAAKLNKLISDFYSSLSSSDESNLENFNLLDKQWRTTCYNVNRIYKFMNLPAAAFEKTIIRNRMIVKINELEPRLKTDYLNTLKDVLLEKMVENKSDRDFMLNEYERFLVDNPSKVLTVSK